MVKEVIVVEYDKIRQEYPEYEESIARVYAQGMELADKAFSGKSYGGMFPKDGQYGITTLLPKFLDWRAGTPKLTTFRQNYGSTGWNNIFTGTLQDGIVIGAIGFVIPDPSIIVNEFRLEIANKKYPRINIEEIHGMKTPAILFREGWLINKKTMYQIRGRFEAAGYQRIIPLKGFAFFEDNNDVIAE